MSAVRAAALWLWEFVVGDDPWTAFGVVIALGLTAVLAAVGVSAWWIMPLAIVVLLASSLQRAAR